MGKYLAQSTVLNQRHPVLFHFQYVINRPISSCTFFYFGRNTPTLFNARTYAMINIIGHLGQPHFCVKRVSENVSLICVPHSIGQQIQKAIIDISEQEEVLQAKSKS
jgi:hypothetical protein